MNLKLLWFHIFIFAVSIQGSSNISTYPTKTQDIWIYTCLDSIRIEVVQQSNIWLKLGLGVSGLGFSPSLDCVISKHWRRWEMCTLSQCWYFFPDSHTFWGYGDKFVYLNPNADEFLIMQNWTTAKYEYTRLQKEILVKYSIENLRKNN